MIVELAVLAATLFGLYAYLSFKWRARHWSRLGVAQDPPSEVPFPLGNAPNAKWAVVSGKQNLNDSMREFYEATRQHPFHGAYTVAGNPVLVVNDLDLVQRVLVKDFSHFVDRSATSFFNGNSVPDEVWRCMLTNAVGQRWRRTRNAFTPIFSSGKIKLMYRIIEEISGTLAAEAGKIAASGRPSDAKELMNRFGMDVIASTAFGVDAKCLSDMELESDFSRHAKDLFQKSSRDFFWLVGSLFPGTKQLIRALGVPIFRPVPTQYLYDLMVGILNDRRRESKEGATKRNDLVDLMLAAVDASEEADDKDAEMMIVSTAVVIIVAGYDTTAMTLAYTLHSLAVNPDVQERLQEEIDAACSEAEGRMPAYADVQELEYLDMVVHESLRLHTPLGALTRGVTEDYTMPGTGIKLAAGTDVHIASSGIHHDPRFYETPEVFNPEHFSKEARAGRHPMAFLAFGQGPRNCIGSRFGLLEAKMGLIAVLSKYTISKCDETPERIRYDPKAMLGNPLDKLMVKIEPREAPSMK